MSDKLKRWLHDQGLSQKEFAKSLGRTPATVSRIVNGINRPDYETLRRIKFITEGEITADDFFFSPKDEPLTDARA